MNCLQSVNLNVVWPPDCKNDKIWGAVMSYLVNHHSSGCEWYLSKWTDTALIAHFSALSYLLPISFCKRISGLRLLVLCCQTFIARLSCVQDFIQRTTLHVCWLLSHFSLTACLFDWQTVTRKCVLQNGTTEKKLLSFTFWLYSMMHVNHRKAAFI